MLNRALTQMLRDPLFVPAGRVKRKPSRPTGYLGYLWFNMKARVSAYQWVVPQGFAILTWVKVFHRSFPRDGLNSKEISYKGKMKASASIQAALIPTCHRRFSIPNIPAYLRISS